jgi:hypothetical protein
MTKRLHYRATFQSVDKVKKSAKTKMTLFVFAPMIAFGRAKSVEKG